MRRTLGRAVVSEQTAQRLQGLAHLARHDPQLVRVAAGDLRKHLQVLVGEQFGVRLALVNRFEDRLDRLRLALRSQRLRLRVGLRLGDSSLRVALGLQDRGLLFAFGGEDLRLLDRKSVV